MKHHFIALCALVAVVLAGVVAPVSAAPTDTPTGPISDADELLDVVRGTDPADVGEETARRVRSWVKEPSNLLNLNESEAREVVDWLRESSVSVPSNLASRLSSTNDTATATATPTATSTPTATPTPAQRSNVSQPVGPITTVEKWTYNEETETMRLLLRTKVPTRVTLSAAPDVGRGVGRFTVQATNTGVGEQWVSINVEETDGAAVVFISTPQCVSAGSCGFVSTNSRGAGDPFADGNPAWGWLGGSLLSVAMFVLAGAWILRTEGRAPEVA